MIESLQKKWSAEYFKLTIFWYSIDILWYKNSFDHLEGFIKHNLKLNWATISELVLKIHYRLWLPA